MTTIRKRKFRKLFVSFNISNPVSSINAGLKHKPGYRKPGGNLDPALRRRVWSIPN